MDILIFNWIHGLAGKSRLLDFLGIFLADYFPYLVAFAAIVLFVADKDLRRKFNYYAMLGLSVILSRGIISEIIRFIYARPRPFVALNFSPLVSEQSYNSFPSGHMTFFFAIVGVVMIFDRKWGWRFFTASAVIGLARIFTGVHWPSDILGGALIGLASAWLAKWIFKNIQNHNQKTA